MKSISNIQYITQATSENLIIEEVTATLDAGVDWIQLRIKNEHLDFIKVARSIKILTDEYDATLILNDKVTIVNQVDADGVHIGKNDMSITKARELLGEDKIIGGTANTLTDALEIEKLGANYIGLGPYQYTTTKKLLSPVLGIKGYQEICPKIHISIVAIGGLELDDVRELKNKTTIFGIALSGLIYRSDNKAKLVKELKEIIQ